MKLSKILKDKHLLRSVTISPMEQEESGYKIKYFFREKTSKGVRKMKTVKAKTIDEDVNIPHTSADTVKHLGYTSCQVLKEDNFYLNFYK